MICNNTIIKEIIIDGFKSYGTQTKFADFDEKFNSITGINGSGKSNILDSICFVLGLTNLSIIRVTKLKDLIFRNEKYENSCASVTIVLQSKKTKNNLLNFKNLKKFIITRKILKSGINKYILNHENVNPSKILNFLFSINININNPHFFIRQGHILKIVHMKPEQLLGIIENAFGTKLYDLKKKIATEIIHKKEEKLKKVKEILMTKIKPHLNLVQKFDIFLQKLKIFKTQISNWKNFCIFFNVYHTQFHFYVNSVTKKLFYFLVLKQIKLYSLTERSIEKFRNKKFLSLKNLKILNFSSKNTIRKIILKIFTVVILLYFTYRKNWEILNLKKKNILNFKKKKTQNEVKFIQFLNKKNQKRKKKIKNIISFNVFIFKFEKKFFNLWKTITIFIFFFYFCLGKIWYEFLIKIYKERHFLLSFIFLKKNFGKKKLWNFLKKNFENNKRDPTYNYNNTSTFSKIKIWKKFEHKMSFFLDSFFPKNKENFWRFRFSIYGLIGSLIKVKKSFLTTSVEFSGYGKLSNAIIYNNIFTKKIIQQVILLKKITIIPLNEMFFYNSFSGENFSNFNIRACLSCNTYFSKPINYIFGRTNIISDISQTKINDFWKDKKVRVITLNGEIFDSIGSVTGGKNNEYGFCFLEFFSESNNGKSWWCRFDMVHFKLKKKKMSLHLMKQIEISFKKKMHNSKFCEIILENKNYKRFYLLYIFLTIMRKNLKSIIFKFKIKKFFLKLSILFFFPKKFYKKKIFKIIKKIIVNRKVFCKKKNFFKKLLTYSHFRIKKQEKIIFQLDSKDLFKTKALKNYLVFYKKIHVWLNILFLLKKHNFKKIDKLLLFFTNFKNFKIEENFIKIFEKKRNRRKKKKNLEKNNEGDYSCIFLNFISLLEIAKVYFLLIKKKIKIYSGLQINNRSKIIKFDQIEYLIQGSNYYKELLQKRALIEKDRLIIQEIICNLDKKKTKIINEAIKKVNSAFQAIFAILLPSCFAKLVLILTKEKKTKGIDFRIIIGQNDTQTIEELSGGQKSILALSFMFSLLLNKPAPFYILDEIDAALDLCHTQNIGKMIMRYFPMSQFIIVSLKNGIILNAKVIFKIRILHGKSFVTRLENK